MTAGHDQPLDATRAVQALRGGGPVAPPRLHARIEALVQQRARVRRRQMAFAAATALALLILLPLIALMRSGEDAAVQLARIADRPPEQPAPAIDMDRRTLLEREFAGVTFPNWGGEFGWARDGVRSGQVDGRATDTVYYFHTHHRIAYTVVDGPPLDPPDDASRVTVDGVKLHRFRDGPLDVVMFVRGGHTCVLSGDVHDPDTLLKLASWRAGGDVRFT
jgi:hypothetical protein